VILRPLTLLAAAAIGLVLAGAADAANPTTLSINCTPKAVSVGSPSSCAVTVTDSGPVAARVPPGGSVTFTVTGTGTFDPGETCALEPVGAFSSKCTVAYTPTAIAGGTHRLLATYNGEDGHGRATSTVALAVTPVNDDFDAAIQLPVPAKVTGTTEGATYADDDPDLCSDAYAPVWYSLKPAESGRVAVRLTVRGRADAVVAVFRQDRSKVAPLGCDISNAAGVAGVPFDATRGDTYVIAVAAPWSDAGGEFALESFRVPAVRFPGIRVSRDRDVALDPLLQPAAAASVQLRGGTTYRIAATAKNACVHASLLRRPDANAGALVTSEGCSGYLAYTPRTGGRLPLLVSVPEGRPATVHIAIRAAEQDDLAPGITLSDGSVHHGALSTRSADAVDMYSFRVAATADATVSLRGTLSTDVLLFDARGKALGCACDGRRAADIVKRVGPGTYLAVVRARPGESGRYGITLRLREPTTTVVRMGAGGALQVSARVRPAPAGGRLVLELDRFDPLSGWQFAASTTHVARPDGTTVFSLRPAVGSWRVRVHYGGTLSASPSDSGWIAFTAEVSGAPGPHGGSCAPGTRAAFAVGALTIACGSAVFGEKPAPPTQTPGTALRTLRSTVAAIPTLKEPFKGDLLGMLDEAINALADNNLDEARAQLEQFIRELQGGPLQAQLTASQRSNLTREAKRIEAQLG
jgi:hypothetical protein